MATGRHGGQTSDAHSVGVKPAQEDSLYHVTFKLSVGSRDGRLGSYACKASPLLTEPSPQVCQVETQRTRARIIIVNTCRQLPPAARVGRKSRRVPRICFLRTSAVHPGLVPCSGRNPLCYQHAHPAGDGHGHDDSNLPPVLLQRGGQVQAEQRGTEDVTTAGAHRIPHVPKGPPVGG